LQCFGDIAGAIGGHFETYLAVVAQVLQQAATITAGADGSYEMFDYVIALREGIMDAWGGIIGAMKSSGKSMFLLAASCPRCFANIVCYSRRSPTLCTNYL
jgi:importin subunit beta-1